MTARVLELAPEIRTILIAQYAVEGAPGLTTALKAIRRATGTRYARRFARDNHVDVRIYQHACTVWTLAAWRAAHPGTM